MSSAALVQAFEARRLRLPNFSWVLPPQENSGGLAGLGAPQTSAHAKGAFACRIFTACPMFMYSFLSASRHGGPRHSVSHRASSAQLVRR